MSSWLPCARTKLNVPLPPTSDVTLYSTHVLDAMAPLLSFAPLVRAGRLFQVMPVSVQLLPVAYAAGPSLVFPVVL
jgi:hypothetical protein